MRHYFRKVDPMGRLGIPTKMIIALKLQEKQFVEISIEYGNLVIKEFNEQDVTKRPYVGIVRRIDDLKRVVIPKEFRQVLRITPEKDFLIAMEQNAIICYPIFKEVPKEK